MAAMNALTTMRLLPPNKRPVIRNVFLPKHRQSLLKVRKALCNSYQFPRFPLPLALSASTIWLLELTLKPQNIFQGIHLMTSEVVEPTSEQSGVPSMLDWLDKEAWKAFVDMRKAKGKRAPFTEAAQKRILWKLDIARMAGKDTSAMLWQSVVAGWSDVYEVKHQQLAGTVESMEVAQTKKLLADQAAHMKTENNPNKVSEAIARMAAARQAIKGKTA